MGRANAPDPRAWAGHFERNPRLHAQTGCERDPRLSPGAWAARIPGENAKGAGKGNPRSCGLRWARKAKGPVFGPLLRGWVRGPTVNIAAGGVFTLNFVGHLPDTAE